METQGGEGRPSTPGEAPEGGTEALVVGTRFRGSRSVGSRREGGEEEREKGAKGEFTLEGVF